jgi:quinol monooxygenase YgiN
MRIIIAGQLKFAGGDIGGEIVRGGAAHIAGSRAEAGCIAYDWSVDPLEPGTLHVFEEWESEAALGSHFRDPSYQAMRAHLEGYEITGFDVKLYSIAGIEPVYDENGQSRDTIFGVRIA